MKSLSLFFMGVQCDEEIITGVDKLLHLVNEKQSLSLTEAANELGVDKGLVEEWTDMLEQDELISVKMNLWEQHLVSTDWHDENVSVLQMLRTALKPARHFKESELKERCKNLRQRERKVAMQMRTINRRLKTLKRYEKLKGHAEQAMKEATQERRKNSRDREELEQNRESLKSFESTLKKKSEELDARMEQIRERDEDMQRREQRIRDQRKRIEEVLSDVPKIVDDLIESKIKHL